MRVSVRITETELEVKFVTYARVPSGVKATPTGITPTGIGNPTTLLVAVAITETVSELEFAT